MDSTFLVAALILLIVLVRFDLMLFAVLTGFFVLIYALIKSFGRTGYLAKEPFHAIMDDLRADAKDIEHAHGNYPSGTYLKGIWDNFVDFLVNDRRGEKKVKAGHSQHGEHKAGHAEHDVKGAHGAHEQVHGKGHH